MSEVVASDWPVAPIGDCMDAVIDYRGKSPTKTRSGIPLVTAKVVKGGRVTSYSDEFIAEAEYDRWMRRGMPRAGDILVTTEAPLGEVAQLDGRRVALAQRLIALRGKPNLLDQRFLLYLMQSRFVQEQLRARGTGTTVVGIRQSELRRVELPLPPLPEQRAIAGVLGALDDKIELNRRMNETLEEIARALFKSWFVDFDPVRAKSEGRQPWGMDAETAALFPSEFEDSELGEIPKGWRVRPLDSIATFLNGLALQKYPAQPREEFLPVIKIVELRKGSTEGADRASPAVPAPYVIEDGDLLFSWSGSLEVAVWAGGRGALNQHLFKVTSTEFPQWFIHQWLLRHLSEFRGIAADKATTMGHIKRHHLTDALTVVPDGSVLDAANAMFSPLAQRWLLNRLESRTLAELRDTLLPRLMSGEVRVRDAERAVEAVG